MCVRLFFDGPDGHLRVRNLIVGTCETRQGVKTPQDVRLVRL
jgi:hypothetical protein